MSGGMKMLSTVLIVILVLALIGALPTWPYSSGWGYYPSGGLGIVVLVVLVLLLTGRLQKEALVSKDKSLVIKSGSFVSDVKELRRRARAHMEQGAVTEGHKANVETVV